MFSFYPLILRVNYRLAHDCKKFVHLRGRYLSKIWTFMNILVGKVCDISQVSRSLKFLRSEKERV